MVFLLGGSKTTEDFWRTKLQGKNLANNRSNGAMSGSGEELTRQPLASPLLMTRGKTIAFMSSQGSSRRPSKIRFAEPYLRPDGDRVTVRAFNLVVLVVVLRRSCEPGGLRGKT